MSSAQFDEEPWEAQIGSMLAGLPDVEPPTGFIDSALDHRPLYSGRTFAALMAVSVVAMVGSVATGVLGRAEVTPSVDDLASRHTTTVQAGVFGTSETDVDYRIETSVDMPDGFERTRNIAAEDLRQALYARGDESVSVFVQEGRVQWESLPEAGLTEVDGMTAWFDEARRITVVEASDNVVTIVGLPIEEAALVLETVPDREVSPLDRVQDAVNAITSQLGYPSLG